ncbi:hypothetical protein HWV23_15635 [Natronomonas halophila]|uniref:DUF7266 family protein n=1 Tax=Natronomonas halophila TaxID=2747817 RepID=UPI0015B3D6AA|nr:hypothetical protein [Natronomonas halophila]QLD87093.1 hypothetical protein HWV23_15635 [Natronomonas halophila]
MGDRGVSTVVSYVLTLAIVAILTTTLLSAFAPFVTDQQQDATQSTLSVLGNDIAGDVDSVDRLATRGGDVRTVEFRTRLPDRIGGSRYEIAVENETTDGGPPYDYEIWLRTSEFEASAVVRLRTRTPVETRPGTDPLDGGTVRIGYNATADRVVIRNV